MVRKTVTWSFTSTLFGVYWETSSAPQDSNEVENSKVADFVSKMKLANLLQNFTSNSTFQNCTELLPKIFSDAVTFNVYVKMNFDIVNIKVAKAVHTIDAKWLSKPCSFRITPKFEYLYYLFLILKTAKRFYLLSSQHCNGFLALNHLRSLNFILNFLKSFQKRNE